MTESQSGSELESAIVPDDENDLDDIQASTDTLAHAEPKLEESSCSNEIENPETGCSDCVVPATMYLPSKISDIKLKTVHNYPMSNEFAGRVLGKAGKSSGRYKNWVNIKLSHP